MSELYHHGIVGQRWGVRRYQTSSGSLTALGKKRYSKQYPSDDEMSAIIKRKNLEKAYEKVTEVDNKNGLNSAKNIADNLTNIVRNVSDNYSKNINTNSEKIDTSKMTNKELQDAITRMNLEDNYIRLKQNRQASERGKDSTQKVLSTIGTLAATASATLGIAAQLKNLGVI